MGKEELMQYKTIKVEIKKLKERIKELEERKTSIKSHRYANREWRRNRHIKSYRYDRRCRNRINTERKTINSNNEQNRTHYR